MTSKNCCIEMAPKILGPRCINKAIFWNKGEISQSKLLFRENNDHFNATLQNKIYNSSISTELNEQQKPSSVGLTLKMFLHSVTCPSQMQ